MIISLEKFKEFKRLLEDTITNKAFNSRMMFEAIEDESFSNNIISFIDRLNNNITSKQLDTLFNEVRELTINYFEQSKLEDNFKKKLNKGLSSLAYFYFLESIDEHSTFSDNVIEEIKNKNPNDYLDIITKLDKKILTSTINDDSLNKYIVLKEWQDKQHNFFEEEFGKYIEELQYLYCNKNLNSFDLEQFTLRKRLFDNLSLKKILDIDTCSILSELYIKPFVINYIGGKMYGLSILNSNGIKIPYTVVIPIGVYITDEDLNKIDHNYEYYSVRSSANIEDGENNSFAGMFDSYINVPIENILENINKVKQSVNNQRLKEYKKIKKINMAVIIQSFKEPKYAGVWIGNSDTSGVLEWVSGNGEKLVSGAITPTTEIWNDNESNNPLKYHNKNIGNIMLEYQKKIESNADFEWMILDDELIMLQFRPVTKKVITQNIKKDNNNYFGIPASPGIVSGEVRYLKSPKEKREPNKILLAMNTDPDWLPHLIKSKGVVTAYGGFLCHTAIICRELGIPCITGIGEDKLNELINSKTQNIKINGNSGEITIL